MRRSIVSGVTAAAVASVVGFGIPLAAALYFRAEPPAVFIFAVTAVVHGLFFLRARLGRRHHEGAVSIASAAARAVCTALIVIIYAAAAMLLLVSIVVIPFSYYLAWLSAVGALEYGGFIALLFTAVTAWFASLFGGLVYSAGPWRPAAGAAVFVCFELAVLFRTPLTVVLFTLAVILAVALLVWSGRKKSARRPAVPFGLVGVSLCAAALCAVGSEPNAGLLTRTSLLSDIKRFVMKAFPDATALQSVSGYGFSYDAVGLGGRPILSSVSLFAVQSRARRFVYLRTQVYDDYFNNNWGVSRPFADRMISAKDDVLSKSHGPLPGLTINVLFDYFPQLPHTLSAEAVSVKSVPPAGIAGGNFDSGFDLTPPLLKGAEVRVYYPAADHAAFPRGFADFAGDGGEEPPEMRPVPAGSEGEKLLKYYLNVPTSLTTRIFELARRLKGKEISTWRILAEIGKYLRENYTYSLDTREPPPKEEFLDDFLFVTRRGYCVHFATAFVVLARCAGIPARYVTGFLALPSPEGDAIVSGLNAHAWGEFYVPGAGWVALEATPAFDPDAGGQDYYRRYNPAHDGLTARQLAAIMGGRILPPEGPKPEAAVFSGNPLAALPFAGAALVLGAAAFLLIPLLKKAVRRRRIYRGKAAGFNRRLCALVRMLERHGVPAPEATGWIAWGAAAGRSVPAEHRRLAVLARTANRIFFGRSTVTKRELRFTRALIVRLSRRLKERGGDKSLPFNTGG